MKKVPFFQKSKSGCASYAMANCFNDPRFIEGTEDMEHGEGLHDINKKLERLQPGMYVEHIFCVQYGFALQENRLVDPLVFAINWEKLTEDIHKNFARPLFITWKNPVHLHSVLVIHELSTDRFHVVDSKATEIDVLTVSELIEKHHILGVEVLCSEEIPDKNDQSVFIHKDILTHIL